MESLWEQAAASKEIGLKWKPQLDGLFDLSCGPGALLFNVQKSRDECREKQWNVTLNGRKIYARDILERCSTWLEKVKQVGDIVTSFDPVHAALPWAGARLLLTLATNDTQQHGHMLEALEVCVGTCSRYTIIEQIYCHRYEGSLARREIRDSTVKVYTQILIFLCKAKSYFDQNTAVRIIHNIGQMGKDLDDLTKAINVKDATVERLRPLADGETILGTSDNLGAAREEIKSLHLDMKKMKGLLLDLEHPVDVMSSQLALIQDGLDSAERRRIMRWLSEEPYVLHHKSIADHRLLGSGAWLFGKSDYQKWRTLSSTTLLWLSGDPGAGKSVLTSMVIDHVKKELERDLKPVPLAYFYCKNESSEPRRSNPTEVMLSILKQLACKNDQVPVLEPVARKWAERVSQGSEHGLDLSECVDLIIEITSVTGAIIVIDALDELQRDKRANLLVSLDKIRSKTARLVRVFASSRKDSDLRQHFRKTPGVEIAAIDNSEDIGNFITKELHEKIASGAFQAGEPSESLVNDVKAALIGRAEGNFRWASLSLQTLCDPMLSTELDVRGRLEQLPKGLEGAYGNIMKQIHNANGTWSMPLAKKTLRWMLVAQQALSVEEFIQALSADIDTSAVTITVDLLLNICCNLVRHDATLNVIRWIHLSAREYLQKWEPEYETSVSNGAVAIACLQNCLYGTKPKRKATLDNEKVISFYDYAQVYWPFHCMRAGKHRIEGKLPKMYNDFMYQDKNPSKLFRIWSQIGWQESWEEMDLGGVNALESEEKLQQQLAACASRPTNPVFCACAFGFLEIIQDSRKFTEKDAKKTNSQRSGPFNVAVACGQRKVVEYLASTSSGSEESNESSLSAAVTLNDQRMVEYLMEQNRTLRVNEEVIETALANADVPIIQYLIEHERGDTREVTEVQMQRAARNEKCGELAVEYLLKRDEYFDVDDNSIEVACWNRKKGHSTLNKLLDRRPDYVPTVVAMERAAANDLCGFSLLTTFFQRHPDLVVTTRMLEAAAGNLSLDPMRLLLKRDVKLCPSYMSLCNAARNIEVGDQMMELLLTRCSKDLIDISLILLAIVNRKKSVELTPQLLESSGLGTEAVTVDTLTAAATSRHGVTILQALFKLHPTPTIHETVAVSAASNLYGPVEILSLLLKADPTFRFTEDVVVAAAGNSQNALDLLLLIAKSDEAIISTPKVIEALAGNEGSGLEAIEYLWKQGICEVTPTAIKNACENYAVGEKILQTWYKRRCHLDVTSKAVERAMENGAGQQILKILLRIDPSLEIGPKAIEVAASNPASGSLLLRMITDHQGDIDVTEELIVSAAKNYETGLEVLKFLLTGTPGISISTNVLEAVVSSYVDSEVLNTLMEYVSPKSVTLSVVMYAIQGMREKRQSLALLLDKNPNLVLPPDSLARIGRGWYSSESVVETFKDLDGRGQDIEITEPLLSGLSVGAKALRTLQELDRYYTAKGRKLPISKEVIHLALKMSGSKRYGVIEFLLKTALRDKHPILLDADLLSVVVKQDSAAKYINLWKKQGQDLPAIINDRSSNVRMQAIANLKLDNQFLKKHLGISPLERKHVQSSETGLLAIIKMQTFEYGERRKLIMELNRPLPITSKVLVAAIEEDGDNLLGMLLAILEQQSAENHAYRLASEITEDVVKQAMDNEDCWETIRDILRHHNIPVPITAKIIEAAGKSGLYMVKKIILELQHQGSAHLIPVLCNRDFIIAAAKSWSRDVIRIFKYLSIYLNEDEIIALYDEEIVLIFSALAYNEELEFFYELVETKSNAQATAISTNGEHLTKFKPQLKPMAYYSDIALLCDATDNINIIEIRRLLKRGVSPNAPSWESLTAFGWCARWLDLCSINVMLEFVDKPGDVPKQLKPEEERIAIDLDAVCDKGITGLAYAAEYGSHHMVAALLAAGADWRIKDKDGKTAQDKAVEAGYYSVGKMIGDWALKHTKQIENGDKKMVRRSDTEPKLHDEVNDNTRAHGANSNILVDETMENLNISGENNEANQAHGRALASVLNEERFTLKSRATF